MDAVEMLAAVVVGAALAGAGLWLMFRNSANAAFDRGRAEVQSELAAATERFKARDEQLASCRAQLNEAQVSSREATAEIRDLTARKTGLETEVEQVHKAHQEKLAALDEAQEQLKATFENLANEILETKAKKFTEQNQQNLEGLLKPLREQIKEFDKKVSESSTKASEGRVSLLTEIKNLKELNQRITEEASKLTNALTGQSKTQGIWGELILERVLEKSGLEKGREYETQVSITSEDGSRSLPDVILHLPEGRDMVIDSKVSLKAYERFTSAENDDIRAAALSEHVASLRRHIKDLSNKAYEKLAGVRTLDFVLMFVPIEAAFSEAARHDDSLYDDALARNIVIVTPTTLLATLRTVENIWRYEHQSQNAQLIAKKAGDLYDKLVGFVSDLEELGKRLTTTQKSYDAAVNKLSAGRGNLIRRAEEMKSLGASTSKSLPESLVARAGADVTLLESGR